MRYFRLNLLCVLSVLSLGNLPGLVLADGAKPHPDTNRIATATDHAVTLYVQDGCGYCQRTRELLQARGVVFRERNIADAAAEADWRAIGGQGVPLLVVGDTRVQGFDQPRIEAALAELD